VTLRKLIRPVLALTFLIILSANSLAEICPGSRIKKAKLDEYDQLSFLTSAEESQAQKQHAPWGIPTCPRLLPQREYIVCYDTERRVALWVSYTLKRSDIVPRVRLDAFRSDPRLTGEENAHCSDYAGSGYDRGHAAPNSDMNRSPEVQGNTYFLSNMSPQTPTLNRGMWRWLEESVRTWVRKFGEVHIMTGSVFVGPTHRLDSGRVAIPRESYKILVRVDDAGEMHFLSFVLINWNRLPVPPGTQGVSGRRINAAQADTYLKQHLHSIGSISRLTGLDLFPSLPAENRDQLERQPSVLWPKN
jgi:DNA/RNA endonuclease G (NUC1)